MSRARMSPAPKNAVRAGLVRLCSGLLIGVALLCLGRLAYNVHEIRQAVRAADWPVAQGQILASQVAKGCTYRSPHRPSVVYQYAHNGVSYTGTRIAFGHTGCGTEASAAEVVSRFAEGQSVRVWLDPSAPATSALQVGDVSSDTWTATVILPLAGFFCVVLARRLWRSAGSA